MSSINQIVSAIVHYDAYVAYCNVGIEFKSEKNVLVSMKRGMTFNALKRKIQQKICLNRGQSITSIICRYPVTVRSGMFNYQAITINDDEDIDGMFDVYNRHECISCFELLIQYEQQPSSITNVETTIASRQIHRTQYTDYHIESYHEGPSS